MNKFLMAIVFVFVFVPPVQGQHTITTVAGGVPNNINPLGVGIGLPTVASLDSSGNLYVGDSLHSTIYKVSVVTGQLTTVAGIGTSGFSGDGGPASSAELNSPQGIFVDNAGDIFIADTGTSSQLLQPF